MCRRNMWSRHERTALVIGSRFLTGRRKPCPRAIRSLSAGWSSRNCLRRLPRASAKPSSAKLSSVKRSQRRAASRQQQRNPRPALKTLRRRPRLRRRAQLLARRRRKNELATSFPRCQNFVFFVVLRFLGQFVDRMFRSCVCVSLSTYMALMWSSGG